MLLSPGGLRSLFCAAWLSDSAALGLFSISQVGTRLWGGILGMLGGALALFTPGGKLRRAAMWLNGTTFLVALVIFAVFFL